MTSPTRPPNNGFVRIMRKAYNPLGFSRGYNFTLWFIFAGALMGFTLARFQYLNFNGIFCSPTFGSNHAAPGECYYYQAGHERVGIILHLAAILPAAFLVVFQFVPVIRYKAILFHRINGYVVVLLGLLSTVGVLMIARNAFGGDMSTQVGCGFLSTIFVGSLVMAYINIKKLQIEQHRAWMLRAWLYAGIIITLRIIMIIAALIVSQIGGYYQARPCAQLYFIYNNSQDDTLQNYPDCEPYFSGEDVNKQVAVEANFNGDAAGSAASTGVNFGMAMWLAIAMHAIGVEIYLRLTPAEFERLRKVSYTRQLEAGMKHPGAAGLTVDRFGDAVKWEPTDSGKDAESERDREGSYSLADVPTVVRR